MQRPARRAFAPAIALALSVIIAACAHHAPPQTAVAPAPAPRTAAHSTAWEDSVVLGEMAADARKAADAKRAAAADERAALAKMAFFDFDQSLLSDADRATLDAKIPILEQNQGLKIQIDGNCDDRGSEEYNLALGERRAAAAKRYLVEHGVPASRIEILSLGKERPVATGVDDASRAMNRNDQFVILAGADELDAGSQ
jgi:peptidoglycan-associated lipoprotein